MLVQGLELTLIGMTGVLTFLLLLVAAMRVQAAVFKYLGVSDETEATDENGADGELVAAAIAVRLKNG